MNTKVATIAVLACLVAVTVAAPTREHDIESRSEGLASLGSLTSKLKPFFSEFTPTSMLASGWGIWHLLQLIPMQNNPFGEFQVYPWAASTQSTDMGNPIVVKLVGSIFIVLIILTYICKVFIK